MTDTMSLREQIAREFYQRNPVLLPATRAVVPWDDLPSIGWSSRQTKELAAADIAIAVIASRQPSAIEIDTAIDTYRGCREIANTWAAKELMGQVEKLALGEDVTVRHDGTVKYWRDEAVSARQRLNALIDRALIGDKTS